MVMVRRCSMRINNSASVGDDVGCGAEQDQGFRMLAIENVMLNTYKI